MEKIHFKLTHGGVTRRIALSRGEEDLLSALKIRVLKITGTDDVTLYWRDEDSLVVLECADDMHAAIDYAQTVSKLGCVMLEVEETQMDKKEGFVKVENQIVTVEESQDAFNGIAFTCNECDCFLGPSNGGRFKCTLCDDYDLCSACLAKNEHNNHAFVRLLNGETEIQIAKEFCHALVKDTPRCTPIFVVKSRNPPGKSDAEKVMNRVEECWEAEQRASDKKLMDIHDLFKLQEKEKREAEKLNNNDGQNKQETDEKREYSRADMMQLKKKPSCLKTYILNLSDSDCTEYSDDDCCRYSDEESEEEEVLKAVIKSFGTRRVQPVDEAVADEREEETERPPSYSVTDDQLINLEDEPPLQSLEVPPPPMEEQIPVPSSIPSPPPPPQLQFPGYPVAYTNLPNLTVQHPRPPFPPFSTDGISQFRHGFQHIEHDLNDGGRRDRGFGQRDSPRDSRQYDGRDRDGFEQRQVIMRGYERPRRDHPRDIYELESERRRQRDDVMRRRENEGRFTIPRGFGDRDRFGQPSAFDNVHSTNRRDLEEWRNYRKDAYRAAIRNGEHLEERGFGHREEDRRDERYGGFGDRRRFGEDPEDCEERRAFRERLDREDRRRRGEVRGFGEDRDGYRREEYRNTRRVDENRGTHEGGEGVPNPRTVHDFHRQTAKKLRLEKEKQRKKEKEDDYVKASQIPAHMVIALLTEEETQKMKNIMELENKLTECIKHLQNNTYSLKPHARIFANGDDVMLIGNIAVDLEKHLRNIRQIIRERNSRESDGECWAKMDDRIRQLKDALMQNQSEGEEYRDISEKLRPILLTSKYTSLNGEPYGNWDDVFVGFMEADPLRDNVAPPRVASANPNKEGIFAPIPRGCKPSPATAAADEDEKTEKKETNEKLLRELYATELFLDHDRMFEVCSKAADLREAIDMMLQ